MPIPSAPLHASKRQQNSLSWRLTRAATLVVVFLILAVTLISTLLIKKERDDAYRVVLQKNLEIRAEHISGQISSISELLLKASQSSLIANALVDSFGKDAYLVPYLQGFRRIQGVPISLVFADFEGKEIGRNSVAGIKDHHFEWLATQLAQNRQTVEIFSTPDGPELVGVYFVYYSRTKTPEGALMFRMRLADLHEDNVALGWRTSGQAQVLNQSGDIFTIPLRVPELFQNLGLYAQLTGSEQLVVPVQAQLFFIMFALAVVSVLVAFFILRRISDRLTAELKGLSEFAEDVKLSGLTNRRAFAGSTKEVAAVAQALNQMLDHLHDLNVKLKDETERKFKSVIENLPGAAFVRTDGPEWNMIYLSGGISSLTGHPPADFLQPHGLKMRDLIPAEDLARLDKIAHEAGLAGQPYVAEYRICKYDKSYCWVWERAQLVEDGAGGWCMTGVMLDISNRKEIETELLHAKEVAVSASVAKSQFLATMSHELRTPLNGILGMSELLMHEDINDENRQRYAKVILDSGRSLLTLLNDILDLSKIEAGRFDLMPSEFRPKDMLFEIGNLFSHALKQKNLSWQVRWKGDEQDSFMVDEIRLRQMLSNLIVNAIKFTHEGGVNVWGEVLRVQGSVAELKFSVQDTGIGVDSTKLPLLFQPFTQLDSSSTRLVGGTGLGLSIVKRLAAMMGGDAGVMNRDPHGSLFWFTVRVALPKDRTQKNETVELSGRTVADSTPQHSGPAHTLKGRRVLVVEDNVVNQMVVREILKKQGMEVQVLSNGREAVSLLCKGPRETDPELVLMDIEMPELDGLSATREIREHEAAHSKDRLPIVAVTARAYESDRLACLEAGMNDVLTKPLDANLLIQKLVSLLADS